MAGFDPRKVLEDIAELYRDLSTVLDMLAEIQRDLLAINPEAEWGDWEWERIASARGWAEGAEDWLRRAVEDFEELKQQLEELKKEYNRRALARHGIKVED